MDRPAAPTAAGFTARPYHVWTGRSGGTYMHAVFSPDEAPYFARASVIAVHRRGQQREALLVGATGDIPELFFLSRDFAAALAAGANEIHVHFSHDQREAAAATVDIGALTTRRHAAKPPAKRAHNPV